MRSSEIRLWALGARSMSWRLDRLSRHLRHLVLRLDQWQARVVAFVTLGAGIDTSAAAGCLVAGALGSMRDSSGRASKSGSCTLISPMLRGSRLRAPYQPRKQQSETRVLSLVGLREAGRDAARRPRASSQRTRDR